LEPSSTKTTQKYLVLFELEDVDDPTLIVDSPDKLLLIVDSPDKLNAFLADVGGNVIEYVGRYGEYLGEHEPTVTWIAKDSIRVFELGREGIVTFSAPSIQF